MYRFRSIVAVLKIPAAALCLASANGQDVVSATAGYIHFADGRVLLDEKSFEFNPALFVHLRAGQHLRTIEGRAELMIMPGSFLRLGPDSEIEMIQAGVSIADVRLTRGSASVELSIATET